MIIFPFLLNNNNKIGKTFFGFKPLIIIKHACKRNRKKGNEFKNLIKIIIKNSNSINTSF